MTFANPDVSNHRLCEAGQCAFLPGSSVREQSYLVSSLLLLVTRGLRVFLVLCLVLRTNTNPSCHGEIFLSYQANMGPLQSPEPCDLLTTTSPYGSTTSPYGSTRWSTSSEVFGVRHAPHRGGNSSGETRAQLF